VLAEAMRERKNQLEKRRVEQSARLEQRRGKRRE
jgi:hypothetical protein